MANPQFDLKARTHLAEQNGGREAFPASDGDSAGLSKREYIATAILQGLAAQGGGRGKVASAVAAADALLVELER